MWTLARKEFLQSQWNLDYFQEAELRWLYAHPDNPRARELLAKEYLSSLWLSEYSWDEKEELRKIRAQIYETNFSMKKILSIDDNHWIKDTPSINHNNWNLDEWNYLCTYAKYTSLIKFWDTQDPLEVMNQIIYQTKKPKPLSQEEAIGLEIWPSDFELFLVSKLWNTNIPWQEINSDEWSLWVLESMKCMRDTMRTKQFLISIRESILHLRKTKDSIKMCDAWCWWVPILAIYACLLDEKVQCTCLELNTTSCEIAKKIIASFWLEDRIQVVHTDATQYSPQHKFDVLVSETMHSWLTEEPMTQIFENLHQYVSNDGDIIPRKVTVKSGLVSIWDFFSTGKVVRIYSKNNLHHYIENTLPTQFTLDTSHPTENIEFKLVADKDDIFMVILFSDLDLWYWIDLKEYESLITMPQAIQDYNHNIHTFHLKKWDTIQVSYTAWSSQNNIKATMV